jgi:hypothetical protein
MTFRRATSRASFHLQSMGRRLAGVRLAGIAVSAVLAACGSAACRGAVDGNPDDADGGSAEVSDGRAPEAGSTDAGRDAHPSTDTADDAGLAGGDADGPTIDAAGFESGVGAGSDSGSGSLGSICTQSGTFCTYDALPFGGPVRGAWGASANDVWASAIEGVLHYDGVQWSRVSSASYIQMTGTGSADVWAVSGLVTTPTATTLAHWNGTTWSNVIVGSSFNLTAVWAGAPDDVWAVAPTGTAVHFDGATWSKKSVGTLNDLSTVFGFAPNDVWVGGATATMLHYDGNTWTSVSTGLFSDDVKSIWGASSSDMWACTSGGTYRGGLQGWSKASNTPCEQVFGLSSKNVMFRTSTRMGGWDGKTLDLTALSLTGSQISSVGGEFLVSSDADTAAQWGVNNLLHGPSFKGLDSYTHRFAPFFPVLMWSSAGVSYAISETGAFATTTGPGSWNLGGSVGTTKTLDAIYGTSGTDIWAVGPSGIATHYDGNAWSAQSLQAATLTDVWGAAPDDFYATGAAAYHWDGAAWTPLALGFGATGASTVTGTASNDVWIGGGSYVYHWDGNAWTSTTLDLVFSGNNILRMQAFAPNDLWLMTNKSDVFHWDGATWLAKGGVSGARAISSVVWFQPGQAWTTTGSSLWGPAQGGDGNEFFVQGFAAGLPFHVMGGPGDLWVWDMELWKHK